MDAHLSFEDGKRKNAAIEGVYVQDVVGHCRTMKVMTEVEVGRVRKRSRKHRYYTNRMYYRLFVPQGRICDVEPDPSIQQPKTVEKSRSMDRHIDALKKTNIRTRYAIRCAIYWQEDGRFFKRNDR